MLLSAWAKPLAVATIVQSLLFGAPALSQQDIGAVTKLPLPRFVSMKAGEAFARRGPGKSHKIDWKFVRRGLPLKVVAEHGHWRRVQDHEGEGGWIHYALLSRTRTALIVGTDVEMFAKAVGQSRLVAKLQGGVVGDLQECREDLCLVKVSNANNDIYRGWVRKSNLWGPLQE